MLESCSLSLHPCREIITIVTDDNTYHKATFIIKGKWILRDFLACLENLYLGLPTSFIGRPNVKNLP